MKFIPIAAFFNMRLGNAVDQTPYSRHENAIGKEPGQSAAGRFLATEAYKSKWAIRRLHRQRASGAEVAGRIEGGYLP
ncbi:MAG TPA: hypothetical protein VG097_06105 [Gemmata sp.]|nr:hypothetical protein [Gemmata sp.]